MNSVLDDNHLLTLPSGERIQFSSNVNFIFETHELIHASPATISRMGVNEFIVETSRAAIVFNSLSHLIGATTPAQFTVGLIRGLGGNLTESTRNELALKVYEATGENPPDQSRPLDVQVRQFSHVRTFLIA
ncbi:unnamed protein product [Trichobilharzia regenti]|nr:unnamed protein product [Trichobilharzia regenti]